MRIQDLYPFVLMMVSLGLLLGVALLTFDYFGDAVKNDRSIVNESVAIAGFTGSTANDEIVSVSYFGNSSINCAPANSACVNVTSSGTITTNSSFANSTYDISYIYEADSTATTAATNINTALSGISNTWLALIIVVVMLAIILGIVIKSFGRG